MVSLTHQPFVEFGMYGRRKLPRSFFFVSRVSKITPSPIPINKGGFTGGFENDLHFVYNIWVHRYPFKWFRKNSPHLYPKTQGFEGVFKRRLYSLFTKRVSTKHLAPPPISIKMAVWQPSKKHSSPIWIKTAFWIPCFEKCSPIVYRPPHLIATGNAKPHPLLKNISHLYARKSGFRDHVSIRIYIMFTNIPSPIRTKNSRFIGLSLICLHFVYVLGALSLT